MADRARFSSQDVDVTRRDDGVVIKRLVQGERLVLTEYAAPRGFTTGPSDDQFSEKAGYVVSGILEIRTAQGVQTMTAGQAYAIPAGLPHEFTVLEDAVIVQVRTVPASNSV